MEGTYAGALGEIADAMMAGHAAACPEAADHRWERCPWTPSVYAAADALDALAAGKDAQAYVQRLVHDRMCRDLDCAGEEDAAEHARLDAFARPAAALIARHREE